ncbi:cytochrome c3 family protein [bacterium]|nr:cytochrome c3 family protein [bacterium]
MRTRLWLFVSSLLAVGLVTAEIRYGGQSASADENKPAPPSDKPVPQEQTNCVRCHLTAGRELTEAVHTFAHSVHDISAGVTCHDCHGGNTMDDAKAHTAEFDFIGTKMSAHLAKCQSCHEDQHKELASGPHAWDQQKKLNIRYPLCVDCHGNHDIGNPPAEFSLSLVCTECHRGFKTKFESLAMLTDAEDDMWNAIIQWRSGQKDPKVRVPADLEEAVADIRRSTSSLVHKSTPPKAEDITPLVEKMKKLATQIRAVTTASARR